MSLKRVLIADDHLIVREGLKSIIKKISSFIEIDDASNGADVFDLVKKNDYDLLVLDVQMPNTDAITLVTNIFAYKEKSRILIFSMNSENLYAMRFLKLGVLGYLEKESDADEIRNALTDVLDGNVYMSANLKALYFEEMMKSRKENPFETLSNREIQVARYLLQGYSYADIKNTLNLHSSTIGTHKTRSFEKLKVRTVHELRELAQLYNVDLSKL
jgi:DNA-binding NarL/FixJ family response regulator